MLPRSASATALLHELLTRGVPGQHSEWKEAPGIGTIPACWDVVRLGDVAEVQQRDHALNALKTILIEQDGDVPYYQDVAQCERWIS